MVTLDHCNRLLRPIENNTFQLAVFKITYSFCDNCVGLVNLGGISGDYAATLVTTGQKWFFELFDQRKSPGLSVFESGFSRRIIRCQNFHEKPIWPGRARGLIFHDLRLPFRAGWRRKKEADLL